MAEKPNGLVEAIKGLNGNTYKVRYLEAHVTQEFPLTLQAETDNALIIGDNNLLPKPVHLSTVLQNAVIYSGEEQYEVQIEIDNNIKADDLLLLLEFNSGNTCKYLILDKI